MTVLTHPNAVEIERPTICIVHFRSEEALVERGKRLIYYQVTIRPDKIVDDFIRFGDTPGDEITGWQPTMDIVIDQVLAKLESAPDREGIQCKVAAS